MFHGPELAALLADHGITHVVTVPDSTIGQWDDAIAAAGIGIVRVCREGEAWAVAGGLHLGGSTPLVLIQCTGLFESGDALRNMLHEWRLPIHAIVGYRSFLSQETLPGDTSLVFTEPILEAWNLHVRLIVDASQLAEIGEHLRACRDAGAPGVTLLAEGKA